MFNPSTLLKTIALQAGLNVTACICLNDPLFVILYQRKAAVKEHTSNQVFLVCESALQDCLKLGFLDQPLTVFTFFRLSCQDYLLLFDNLSPRIARPAACSVFIDLQRLLIWISNY